MQLCQVHCTFSGHLVGIYEGTSQVNQHGGHCRLATCYTSRKADQKHASTWKERAQVLHLLGAFSVRPITMVQPGRKGHNNPLLSLPKYMYTESVHIIWVPVSKSRIHRIPLNSQPACPCHFIYLCRLSLSTTWPRLSWLPLNISDTVTTATTVGII